MKSWVMLAGALGVFAAGCTGPGHSPSAARYEAIYQRATNVFASADFLKPAESANSELSFALAPLILLQVADSSNSVPGNPRLGSLTSSNAVNTVKRPKPAIYWNADAVQINGQPHAQFSYVWFYPEHEGKAPLAAQGIRITLNSSGKPAIWEVLTEPAGARVFFVSRSLEDAARKEFGRPEPGRHYAAEQSMEAAPDVVVARVIEDGPIAMGPIVYLTTPTHAVSTVICRCMPAQAQMLGSTSTYELWPWQTLTSETLAQAGFGVAGPLAFWPGEPTREGYLEHCLRLPRNF